jgi:tRNA 2-thiocytidine biosynthesis protein TtcA
MEHRFYRNSSPLRRLYYSPKVVKFAGRANGEFKLVEEGDKILVGVSGGKDSFVLLHILNRMRLIAPFRFEIVAVTVDGGTGIDYTPIARHCEEFEIPYILYKTPILEIIREKGREGSSVCSFCARLRRGALYTKALELGCNKIALGHHFDDAVETFFMGLFYNGIMRTLPPKYRAYNGLEVIRPLIKVREKWIEFMAQKNNFPIISGEESCLALKEGGEKLPYARRQIKEWLRQLERDNPKLFQRLENGFSNLHCDTFFNYFVSTSPTGEMGEEKGE